MAHITGSFRIGRDAELRRTPSGEAVCNLALAYNYGQRDDQGNRHSQWVEASLWGKRAEALAQYLVKGGQVYAVLGEPHIEHYEGRNGAGVKLVARVVDIELTSKASGEQPAQRQAAPAPRPQPQRQAPANTGSGFDDMDSDIPF
jgi:single-strand DNA-binding protein